MRARIALTLALILALTLALLLAACVPVSKPTVTLAGIGIDSIGLFEQRFVLRLRVNNPNDMDLPIDSLRFELEVAGQPFASGSSSQAVTIPRRGEGVLEVLATSNLGDFLRRFGESGQGEGSGFDYRLRGDMAVAGYGSFPFDSRGQIPFFGRPGGEEKRPSKPLPGAV